MRSIRSSSRARTSERGFALIAAIALAILYFALIELMLIDSARELAEARRFRARIAAATLAESGAELAARNMTAAGMAMENVSAENWQGAIEGSLMKAGNDFEIQGKGSVSGITKAQATVSLKGKINGNHVTIYYASHTP